MGILSSALYITNLGDEPFIDRNEAVYAQVVRNTTMSQNPFTLKLSDEQWTENPPIYFWSVMIVEKISHSLKAIFTPAINDDFRPNEFTMRLPTAIAGVVSIILVWLIVLQKTRSRKIATISSLILLTSGIFIDGVRQVNPNVLVIASILFAYYAYIRADEDRSWIFWVWIAIATGCMVGGFVGMLAIPIIALDIITNKKDKDFSRNIAIFFRDTNGRHGLLIAALTIFPWHIYQILISGGAILHRYNPINIFTFENAEVMKSIAWIIGGGLPWSILFIIFAPLVLAPPFFINRIHYNIFTSSLLGTITLLTVTAIFFDSPSIFTYPFLAITVAIGVETIQYHFFKIQHAKHIPTLLTVVASIVLIIVSIATSISIGQRRLESMQEQYQLAKEEREAGLKIYPLNENGRVYQMTENGHETFKFYSAENKIKIFNIDTATSTGRYYIIAKRTELADVLNSPALKFSSDFTVEYLGTYITLIMVENHSDQAKVSKTET